MPSEQYSSVLSVPLPEGRNVTELVDVILDLNRQGREFGEIVERLTASFALSEEDAELAVDRACGGLMRAMTGREDNCPNRASDPIAWESFQRAMNRR